MPNETPPRPAAQVTSEEAATIRAKLLEVAAALDRIDRADGPPDAAVLRLVEQAIAELTRSGRADRAERIQRLYSRPYDPAWRERFLAAAAEGA